jgi:hypothetical protein
MADELQDPLTYPAVRALIFSIATFTVGYQKGLEKIKKYSKDPANHIRDGAKIPLKEYLLQLGFGNEPYSKITISGLTSLFTVGIIDLYAENVCAAEIPAHQFTLEAMVAWFSLEMGKQASYLISGSIDHHRYNPEN